MDWRRVLLFYLPLAFIKNNSKAWICKGQIRIASKQRAIYYCCSHYVFQNGKCKECPIGFASDMSDDLQRKQCKKCPENLFGYRCNTTCYCKENERCDNVQGCLSLTRSQSTISANVITHNREETNSDTGFQNKERFIHIGSSCLLAIFVFILITYICYKKTRRKPALENEKSKDGDQDSRQEKHLVQWIKDQKNTDDNDYDEIDNNLLSDIQFPTNEEKDSDSVEDDENSNPVKEEVNEGYLNPYQPIISTEVHVHHYDSTNDYSNASDENERFSGYLHPYQLLVMNSTEAKNEYTEIEPELRTKENIKTMMRLDFF